MSIFTLDLDETEREAMEAHRIRLGLRSGAETIRALLMARAKQKREDFIEDGDPSLTGAYRIGAPGYAGMLGGVEPLSRPAFNPQPKVKAKK